MTFARIRSLELRVPTRRGGSPSTTSTLVMRCCSIRSAASTASASAETRRGWRCITSLARKLRRSAPRSISRRKSPSVKMPSTPPASSTTAVKPRPLPVIWRSRSFRPASGPTRGTSSPWRIRSRTWINSLRPSAPPGCERAKSSSRKPRASSSATASASPRAICVVVLAVGVRFNGQASCSTVLSISMSACRASVEAGLPVRAINGTCRRRSTGTRTFSSSLSPELEIAMTMSPAVTMPRSPWLASAGCTNIAGVPVEASVAAILRPTCPLLPMPITTTRPRQASIASTARTKPGPSRCLAPSSAAASMSSVRAASASARAASNAVGGTTVVEGACTALVVY